VNAHALGLLDTPAAQGLHACTRMLTAAARQKDDEGPVDASDAEAVERVKRRRLLISGAATSMSDFAAMFEEYERTAIACLDTEVPEVAERAAPSAQMTSAIGRLFLAQLRAPPVHAPSSALPCTAGASLPYAAKRTVAAVTDCSVHEVALFAPRNRAVSAAAACNAPRPVTRGASTEQGHAGVCACLQRRGKWDIIPMTEKIRKFVADSMPHWGALPVWESARSDAVGCNCALQEQPRAMLLALPD
jgi:hypothetical protein